MKYPLYNQKGEERGTVLLPKNIFEVKINNDLIHQVVLSQSANRRQVLAHTKDRSEVSGGGRKPWRQKGTGRARHGSIRSPIWRGGGVTFGPTKGRVFSKRIPKKMKRKALLMALSAKASESLIIVLDKMEIEKPKTKEMAGLLKLLRSKIKNLDQGSALIILSEKDKNVFLSARNIPGLKTMEAKNMNVLDLLSFKYLIMSKPSIKVIQETFLK